MADARAELEQATAQLDLVTLEREQMSAVRGGRKLPPFRPGDTLKVNVKVVDVSYDEKTKQQKTRERLQAFSAARSSAGKPRGAPII